MGRERVSQVSRMWWYKDYSHCLFRFSRQGEVNGGHGMMPCAPESARICDVQTNA